MTQSKVEENYIQQIFYVVLTKLLPTWADATKFAEKHNININTMKAAYYNDGQAGISAMNQICQPLLNLTPEKIAAIINEINNIEPIPESLLVWNSLNVSEGKKLRYAHYAKAIAEIEKQFAD